MGEPEGVGRENSPGVWESIESPFSAVSPFSWWVDMALFLLVVVASSLGLAVVVVP